MQTPLPQLHRENAKAYTVVWDFNGTLLNDIEACLDALNILLRQRHKPTLEIEQYRRAFLFPVADFYRTLGIDPANEPHWEAIAESFHLRYLFSKKLRLQSGAAEAVRHLHTLGVRQGVLSALEQGILEVQLQQFGLAPYMDFVVGSHGYTGASKTDAARSLALTGDVVMIGDTLHDAEVAQTLGWQAILCAAGHQVRQRLCTAEVPVIGSIAELIEAWH